MRIVCTQLKDEFLFETCGFLCSRGVRIARKLSCRVGSDWEDLNAAQLVLDASASLFFSESVVVVCESGPPIFCMFRLYVDLLTQRAGYTIDDIYGDAC